MSEEKGIVWADILAMYEKLGKEWNKQHISQLRMCMAYALDFVNPFSPTKDLSYYGEWTMLGCQIVFDDTLCYGEWRMLDQHGNTLKESLFPVQDFHVSMHNLMTGNFNYGMPFRTNMLGEWPIGKFGFYGS